MARRLAGPGLLAALLAGCAAPQPVHYLCDDGSRFSVALHRDDTASIEFRGMRFPLRQEPSTSGAKYSCDVLTLLTRGDEATLEVQGSPAATNCRRQ